jgi:hypothetical protein
VERPPRSVAAAACIALALVVILVVVPGRDPNTIHDTAAPDVAGDPTDALRKLAELHEQGLVTRAE